MKCKYCGSYIPDSSTYCFVCGGTFNGPYPSNPDSAPTTEPAKPAAAEQEMTPAKKKILFWLCTLSLIMGYLICPALEALLLYLVSSGLDKESSVANIITSISGLAPICGIVLMIIARVMFPNSKYAKIVMWIYVASYIITIAIGALFMISCVAACVSCENSIPSSGCY